MQVGILSRNYNEAKPNEAIQVSCKQEGFGSIITVIEGGRTLSDTVVEKVPVSSTLKGTIYPDFMAEGIKITVEGTTYLVVVCHQEVNTPTDLVQIENCMGYGNVIVFKPDEAELVGTVLNW